MARRHDAVRAAMTLDERLDDIKRAQIWARLEDRLAARVPTRWRLRWTRTALGGLAALAAAAVLVVMRGGGRSAPGEAGRTLVAPSDTTLTLRLGDHTRAALIGPARLDVLDTAPGAPTVVRLRSGTLLGELTGGHGRALQIATADAMIEIVGTLFAVAVGPHATCVSVDHGTVEMTTARHRFTITGGRRACSDGETQGDIDAPTRGALARHAAVILAADEAVAGRGSESPPSAGVVARPARDAAVARDGSLPAPGSPGPAQPTASTEPPDRVRPTVEAEPSDRVRQTVGAPAPGSARPADWATPTLAASAPGSTHPADRATPTVAASAPGSTRPADRATPTVAASAPGSTHPADRATPTVAAPGPPPGAPVAPASAPGTRGRMQATSLATEPPVRGVPRARDLSGARATTATPSPVEPAPALDGDRSRVAAPSPVATTAASLYRDAEAALARRELAAADASLARLLAEFPESALLDQALYERARIAYLRHAWRDAQRQLDRLATITASPLAEPGAYLACRIAVEASDGDAERCLVAYRAAYPGSPHDRDVLGWLADLAFRSGGCAAATSRIAELVHSYPATALARGWLARCPEAR